METQLETNPMSAIAQLDDLGREVLKILESHYVQYGNSPSMWQMSRRFGRSLTAIQTRIVKLEELGLIEKRVISRNLCHYVPTIPGRVYGQEFGSFAVLEGDK